MCSDSENRWLVCSTSKQYCTVRFLMFKESMYPWQDVCHIAAGDSDLRDKGELAKGGAVAEVVLPVHEYQVDLSTRFSQYFGNAPTRAFTHDNLIRHYAKQVSKHGELT